MDGKNKFWSIFILTMYSEIVISWVCGGNDYDKLVGANVVTIEPWPLLWLFLFDLQVDSKERIVYETYISQKHPIRNYFTWISGISRKDLKGGRTFLLLL